MKYDALTLHTALYTLAVRLPAFLFINLCFNPYLPLSGRTAAAFACALPLFLLFVLDNALKAAFHHKNNALYLLTVGGALLLGLAALFLCPADGAFNTNMGLAMLLVTLHTLLIHVCTYEKADFIIWAGLFGLIYGYGWLAELPALCRAAAMHFGLLLALWVISVHADNTAFLLRSRLCQHSAQGTIHALVVRNLRLLAVFVSICAICGFAAMLPRYPALPLPMPKPQRFAVYSTPYPIVETQASDVTLSPTLPPMVEADTEAAILADDETRDLSVYYRFTAIAALGALSVYAFLSLIRDLRTPARTKAVVFQAFDEKIDTVILPAEHKKKRDSDAHAINRRIRALFFKKVMTYKKRGIITVDRQDTPRRIAHSININTDEDVTALTDLYQQARYSDTPVSPQSLDALHK